MFQYLSPLGRLYLASNGSAITGLWIEGQKYFPDTSAINGDPSLPVFQEATAWLEGYFSGQRPLGLPPLAPQGSKFQQAVWNALLEIPYGQTRTYGELAKKLASSPRAVGNAVGHNPISILIPCHRIVGADGSLTGYAGGVEKKCFLLGLERENLARREKFLFLPEAFSTANPALEVNRQEPAFKAGKFPCPCCGHKTLPVPKEEAIAYICPVCYWENDVFDPGEDQPSGENGGMTLRQGREAYKKIGAVQKRLLPYVRKPLPEEMP